MATNHGVGGSNPSSPTTGPKGKGFFGGRKIMIGIAGPKLWNLDMGLLLKWNGLLFSFYLVFSEGLNNLHIVCKTIRIFLFYASYLPQPGFWAE